MSWILSRVRTELPGVSDAQVKQLLFEVYHEFFGMTSAWQNTISVAIKANQKEYEVSATDPGQVIRLAGVLDAALVPQPAIMPSVGTILLQNTPSADATYYALLILNVYPPTGDNTPAVPEWVVPVWGPVILEGVLGRLMSQPTKPYSNEQLGVYHLKRFRDGMAAVRTAMLRRNTFGTNVWAYPQAFRTRGQRGGVSVGGNVNRF